MKLLNYYFFSICTILCCFNLSAQEPQVFETIDEGSINDQFEFVIKKSTNWNDERGQSYEVIRRNLLGTLRSHAVDSLKAAQEKFDLVNKTVATQKEEINTLSTQLTETQNTLEATNQEKDSMSFFGASMSKGAYNTLMWSIIAALGALVAFFFIRFKNSNLVTKSTKEKLAELEEEYKEHRRLALEREQKIKRELQDEINKQRG